MTKKLGGMVLLMAVLMLFAGALLPAGSVSAKDIMHEGRWETTTQIKMEGIPFDIPPVKVTQCITKNDMVPKQKEGDTNCKMKSQKITGSKVTWSQECMDKGTKIESQGEITYSGDKYDGRMTMKTIEKSGQASTSTAVLTGRRIGACDNSKTTASVDGQEMPDMDAMMAESKRVQAELNKPREIDKRSSAFEDIKVPAADEGACSSSGSSYHYSYGCSGKVKLNLDPGQWEITLEEGTRTPGVSLNYKFQNSKSSECITAKQPVPSAARKSFENGFIKASSNRIAWNANNTDAAINYMGNKLEGVMISEGYEHGQTTETKTRITGRRVAKGDCEESRDYTSQNRKKNIRRNTGADEAADRLKGFFGH